MPQLHCYVPDTVAEAIKTRAKARGMSVSQYLATLAEQDAGAGWPPGYFTDVLGSWEGELERPDQGSLQEREPL
jgi:hypothetical protein